MGEHVKKKKQKFDLSFNPRLMLLGFTLILILIMYYSPQTVGILISQGSSFEGTGSTGTYAPMQAPRYIGSVDIEISHRNALDTTEARVEGKDLVTTFYKKLSNDQYMLMGSGDFKGLHVNDYTLFFTVESNSSSLYVSPMHTADTNLNPRILSFDFFDIDNDHESEWVFEYDITGISKVQNAPSFAIYTMSIDEGQGLLTSPSDIDIYPNNSINNINWELIIPEEKGIAISRVSIIFDKTDSSLFNEQNSYIRVPYIDNLELYEMNKIVKSSEIVYSYEFDKDLGNSGYIFTNRNEFDHHDMSARIHTYLSESKNLGVTLEVRFINPDRSYSIISDKVNLHATFEADPKAKKVEYLDDRTEFTTATVNYYINSTDTNYTLNYRVDFEK